MEATYRIHLIAGLAALMGGLAWIAGYPGSSTPYFATVPVLSGLAALPVAAAALFAIAAFGMQRSVAADRAEGRGRNGLLLAAAAFAAAAAVYVAGGYGLLANAGPYFLGGIAVGALAMVAAAGDGGLRAVVAAPLAEQSLVPLTGLLGLLPYAVATLVAAAGLIVGVDGLREVVAQPIVQAILVAPFGISWLFLGRRLLGRSPSTGWTRRPRRQAV